MRVAVVGSGVAGLVSAWLLARDGTRAVVLYEAQDRVGGHVNTVDVPTGDGRTLAVDTGFIVFNETNYPGLCQLFDELHIASKPSDMSFSVQCARTGLEYRGSGFGGFFAQRRNLLRRRHWRLLKDILRFFRTASEASRGAPDTLTLGAFLTEEGYGTDFVAHFAIPMGAALWSARGDRILEFPARYFVEFFENHAFLDLTGRPTWRVVEGGSRTYVEALLADYRGEVRLSAPVTSVRRGDGEVSVRSPAQPAEAYDAVVLALHADLALRILDDASEAERGVLGAFTFQKNDTLLHTDTSMLPRARGAWASWNYHVPVDETGPAAVTYDMNRLQGLDEPVRYLVTLNRWADVAPDAILQQITYHHPVHTPASRAAQLRKGEISGRNMTCYAGAYWGYGFHEDGVQSAFDACRRLGVELS